MAGWKLRKDKTPAETPGAEAEAAASAEKQTEEESKEPIFSDSVISDSVSGLPEFDLDTDLHLTDLAADSDMDSLKSDDGPLMLMDYSEPDSESTAEESFSLDSPSPDGLAVEAPALAIPPLIPADDFQQRLRTGRFDSTELAPAADFGADFGSGIPTVAPFVLDTPVPAAPQEHTRQLVVRLGRLSAAFALTKEVTTIGRPDSVLHYYPDVEIEMDDAVSRRHAEILKRPDGFFIADYGSTNGTMLNGEVLPPHQERLLAHGDRIRVGERTEIIFE